MRKGGGKSKGASFERQICKDLSMWVSNGKQEDVFWRSAISGGRATVAAAKGKRLAAQSGDISCIHPIGHIFAEKFYLECKNYRDLNYSGLFTGKGKLIEFWLETRKQAAHYSKHPLLIAKQNQQPIIICLDRDGLAALQLHPHLSAPKWALRVVLFTDFLADAVRPKWP